jgi:hypothetical protein
MSDLLFAAPWYLPALTALIGIALLISGNSRQSNPMKAAGAVVLGLGVVWFFLGLLVDTPRKICEQQTRQYVQAIVDGDWPTVTRLMEASISLSVVDSPSQSVDRQKLADFIKSKAAQIGLKGAALTDVESKQSDGTVVVTIKVFSTQEMSMDRPVDSEWELTWAKSGSQWSLHQIHAIRVSGIEPGQIRRNVIPQ